MLQILTKAESDDPCLKRKFAVTLNNMGNICHSKGDMANALSFFTQAGQIFRELITEYDKEAEYQRYLSGILQNLASALHISANIFTIISIRINKKVMLR